MLRGAYTFQENSCQINNLRIRGIFGGEAGGRSGATRGRVFGAILPPDLPIICAILLKVPYRFTALKISLGVNLRRNFCLENVPHRQILGLHSLSNSVGLAENLGNPSRSLPGNRQRPMFDDAVLADRGSCRPG